MSRYRTLVIILTVLWVPSSTWFAFSDPAGALAPATGIEEARLLTVAQDSEGLVWATWEGDTGTDVDIYFSRWDGQAWSPAQPVRRQPLAWDRSPGLTVAADGTPWLAWTAAEKSSPGRSKLYVSRWQGSYWTEPEAIPLGGMVDAAEPALAAGPDGRVWLAWVGFDENRVDGILVNVWDGTTWSAPQQVSSADDDPLLYDRQPKLAVGTDGRPWLVWTGHQQGVDDEIYSSHWTGTTWTAEEMVSRDDATLDTWPTLAIDAQGRPWVAWQAQVADEARGETRFRIFLSRWDADSNSWTAEQLGSSPMSEVADEIHPALAADKHGALDLAWLARGSAGTAMAHRRWTADRWSGPVMVRNDVDTQDVILLGGQPPALLWLMPEARPSVPVSRVLLAGSFTPLRDWIEDQGQPTQPQGVPPIPDRYLAFGDSITWGQYPTDDPQHPPFQPYPSILEGTLDIRVTPDSTVINAGEPGERTQSGKFRIKEEVIDYRPTFVLIMEGTNDVSRGITPAEGCENLKWMIDEARKNAGVDDVRVMLATVVPRLDDKNDETAEFNQGAILCAQQAKEHVRLCDPWQAFQDYGNWPELYQWWEGYYDTKHPNQEGLQLLADTFYACIRDGFGVPEESTPPTAWIASLPAQSECSAGNVTWSGQDNLTPVEQLVYDVQKKVNGGDWTDWRVNTTETGGSYTGDHFGDVLGFRVRARDLVGNVGDWSDPAYTTIGDSLPPQASVDPLPAVQLAPFRVSWGGSDSCSAVIAYNVQYKVGAAGGWTPWKSNTALIADDFDPATPAYGETYYFRVQAKDEAGNWSGWSAETQTILARFSLRGSVYNVRRQPVIAAQVSMTPAPLQITPRPGGGFLAYLAEGGNYDLTVRRDDRYGSLPTMHAMPVGSDVSGLEFILPPQDDAVRDGDFEGGDLDAWRTGGSVTPTLTTTVHTGQGAVRLGGAGGDSHLSQIVTPALTLTLPTLSLLARLETPGPVSTLTIELANQSVLSPPVTYTLTLADDAWSHAWLDLSGLISAPLTLTLTVSDSAPILVDEIRLGSARPGGYCAYLPYVHRASEP